MIDFMPGTYVSCENCSEYSKQLNDQRIKVLSARESAIQEIVTEAKLKLREVSKNPTTYKKLLTDLLVQVMNHIMHTSMIDSSNENKFRRVNCVVHF